MSDVRDRVAPAAADTTLETVIGVWQRVLQRGQVLPSDNFFEVGGDSLLAIQLFAELERVTGRNLPITTIYDASTAANLAHLLDTTTDQGVFSPLVLANDVPGGPPIFLIHGIGGNVMELARLGKSIEPDRRVFSIQARGLDGVHAPIESVEEMAEYYLAAVRQEQPQGPYVFIGYSFGGIIAVEMAKRVEASGEQVAFLGFIDSYPHSRYWPLSSWLDVRWRRAANKALAILKERLARLRDGRGGKAAGWAKRGPNALMRPFMFDENWPEAVRRTYDVSVAALVRYQPRPYRGPVVFFRAASRSFYLPNDPHRMWNGLVGSLDVVTVPGDHVDMIGPNAAFLGAQLALHVRAGLARMPSLGRA